MNTRSKKGYVLIMLSFLIAICVSLGMVSGTAVTIFGRDTVKEVRNARAYYYAVAGQRYADLVVTNFPALVGGFYTVTGQEFGGNFKNDLQLGTMQLDITITNNGTGSPTISSVCTYE